MTTLRPYQTDSLNMLRSNIAKGVRAQVLQLCTGAGKTVIASTIMQGAVAKKDGRAFFIVDSLELVDQAVAQFTRDGLDVGVIQGQHHMTDYSKRVQVATIQTLRKRWEYIAADLTPTVVVIDECHVLHDAHEKIINECKYKNIAVVGLSATPFRKGLGKVFDDLVVGATTRHLTDLGFLVPAICYAPFVPELKGMKTSSGGDWMEDALADLMGDADIVGNVVDNWVKRAEGRQTIVFAANVAHSRLLDDEFKRRGIKSAHIDGYERDMEVRTGIINQFRSREITVLCNVAVLTKGFDAPETSCIVLARPTKSLMLHIQCLGRGLRTAEGKTNCIVLDHAGNCLRNGVPTDDLPAELDDGTSDHNLDRKQREKKEPISKPCSSCGAVSTLHKCPRCGFAPEARKDVDVIDGELHEIVEVDGGSKSQKKINRDTSMADKALFFGGLMYHAETKGYKPGWAVNQYREKFGVWPNAVKAEAVSQHNLDAANWVKHKNIRYAKGKKAA